MFGIIASDGHDVCFGGYEAAEFLVDCSICLGVGKIAFIDVEVDACLVVVVGAELAGFYFGWQGRIGKYNVAYLVVDDTQTVGLAGYVHYVRAVATQWCGS